MNAFVDQIVEQHEQQQTGMAAECVYSRRTACLPISNPPLYRVCFNIPGFSGTGFNTESSADAYAAMEGALFCGAGYATIEWVLGNQYVQEIWAAVQS